MINIVGTKIITIKLIIYYSMLHGVEFLINFKLFITPLLIKIKYCTKKS